MSAPQDFFEKEAVLDEEEDGEGGAENEEGEEASKKRKAANHVDDSSEESEDDDEEAAREVQEGFIVDDEDEEPDARSARRREKKRRRQEEREREDEILDEEDLDLIGEANPGYKPPGPSQQSKFKRLKRGHRAEKDNINDMFNSEDEEEAEYGHERRRIDDGLGDFIEEDVFSDEEHAAVPDDEEVALPTKKGISGVAVTEATGLDEAALEDMRLAFGDGEDYRFALDIEDAEDNEQVEEKQLDLKDVFEPAQLAEKMMTEEDDIIRMTDEPERHQIARKPYAHVMLTMEQFQEEAVWISNMMLLKKRLDSDLHEPFQRAVSKVLEFMVTEDREVPFIFQHRKDYLIHAVKVPISPSADKGDGSGYEVTAQKLLNMLDLWEIFELDLKFRALIDKRNTLQKTYDNLQSLAEVHDDVFEALLPAAVTVDELQDIQEYVYFQYPVQLRDVAMINGSNNQNGAGRRKATTKTLYERVRGSRAYEIVKAFGITAEAFAKNASKEGARTYTEDPTERPDEMADNHLDSYFSNGVHVLKAAKAIFAEELVMSPRFRKVMRQAFFMNGIIECFRTEKGLKKIDEQHPYYEFKYLRNQQLSDIARRPELFLRMLKAEEEGLVDVKVQFENFDSFKKRSYRDIESDNQSELADAWNRERRDVLDMAFTKLENIMSRSVKENIRTECENHVAKECREAFAQRLDQAPYKPKGMVLGTVPRVLAITNGSGILGRDPLYWAWTEEDGRVLENGQFKDLTPGDSSRMIEDGADVKKFVDLVERRRPDVIGVSGFTPDSRKLQKLLTELVDVKDLRGSSYTDDDDREISDRLEVMIVNDEVARLYQGSDRANMEHPGFSVLTRYCVALAKYLQSPMKEYAALGRDIVSLTFKPGQQLVPQDKLLRHLESALVDMVNLCGVDINEAIIDTSTANLLPYICGLGPRKAAQLVKVINMNGGTVSNRIELLGESVRYPAMSVEVWRNSASFLFIDFDSADADADYLDNTRIHPEDYDIARKIAADALELDEEDIKAETDENGPGAIVRKLVKEDAQDSVNYLILEKYAEQLEKNLNQRKRATLETIRAELQQPYEELRKQFAYMSTDAIFTMFTGETSESLAEGMVVPVSLKRVTDDHVDGKLDCGVDAVASETELSDRYDIPIRTIFAPFQTVQAKVLSVNKKTFQAHISLRQARINQPYHRNLMHSRSEWDEKQEDEDREALREKDEKAGRAVRVIKHPLFRPFNAKQAEDFLSNQTRGDAVIRPSSKGPDHLAVTWKVSDGVYQHIDVLELDKENEYSVGRILRVGGRYSYSDLDELYVNHIRMMARKVDDMMVHEKYQTGTKEATEKWLATYIRANPTRSAYAFCIDPKHPGYFHLCFQAGARAQVQSWPVKVIPQGYELRRTPYPDMMALCNGFKMVFSNLSKAGGSGAGGMSGILNSGLGVGGYR